MTRKQLESRLLHYRWMDFYNAKIISGDCNILAYISNFDYFMTELRKLNTGMNHRYINTELQSEGFYSMPAKTFATIGSVELSFPEGSIVYSQHGNLMSIKVLHKEETK